MEAYSNELAPCIKTIMGFTLIVEPTNKMNKRLEKLIQDGTVSGKHGEYIDCRSMMTRDNVSGTITTTVDHNINFVAVPSDEVPPQEPQVLGWSRDADGKITNRHPVQVANTLTAQKENTMQNYVVEREVLNATADGCATTLTTAHHYSGNIIDPKRGQKEMGVLEILNADKKYINTTENETRRIFEEVNETNAREVLRFLWQEIGAETVLRTIGGLDSLQQAEVLQSGLYEKGICVENSNASDEQSSASISATDCGRCGAESESVRDMWSDRQEVGCSSFGWELSQQFIREFDACLSKLPHETASANKCVSYLRQACSEPWFLQQTLFAIQEVRQSVHCVPQNSFRIRKLTPRTCFRLMGVSDEDIDKIQAKGISKTQQYKLAGNSIVVDVLEAIFRKVFIDPSNEDAQLTLF